MTPTDKALLCAIRQHDAPSLRELGEDIGRCKSEVHRRLSRLQDEGFVTWTFYKKRTLQVCPHVATGWVQGEPWVGVVE